MPQAGIPQAGMPQAGAALSFELAFENNESVLILTATEFAESVRVRGSLSGFKLSEIRKYLKEELDEFNKALETNDSSQPDLDIYKQTEDDKDIGWRKVSNAMHILYRCGTNLAGKLFRNSDGALLHFKARDLCVKAFPQWDQGQANPRLVQVKAPVDLSLPVEFLPLFDIREPEEIDSPEKLLRAARVFLGFSTIIKRNFSDLKISNKTFLEYQEGLPLKFFQNRSLRGARLEDAFFSENKEILRREPSIPNTQLDSRALANSIAKNLWNPTPISKAGHRQPFDQVLHFACHCSTEGELSDKYSLRFSHDEKNKFAERRVTIDELNSCYYLYDPERETKGDGLVFFSACGGSRIDPLSTSSFPYLMLSNGNCGFIGTETKIPDSFAAAFTEQFYLNLLSPQPVGLALYNAKKAMLMRHMNPLGILYTMYADPDLQVLKPRANL